MSEINNKKLGVFLDAVETLAKKKFDSETRQRWAKLSDDERQQKLRMLKSTLGINDDTWSKMVSEVLQPPKIEKQTTTEKSNNPVNPVPEKVSSIRKKPAVNFEPIVWLFVVILSIAGVILAFQYYHYSRLKPVYCLTNNVVLRSGNTPGSEKVGRMDLFGKAMNTENKVVSTSDVLYTDDSKDNEKFLNVRPYVGFWQWMRDEQPPMYVYRPFVTRSRDTFLAYQRIFANMADDHNEMNRLKLAVRKTIFNALAVLSTNDTLVVAAPAWTDDRLDPDKPYSILAVEDSITNVIYRLTNGKYYNITSGNDGTLQHMDEISSANDNAIHKAGYKFILKKFNSYKAILAVGQDLKPAYISYKPYKYWYIY